MSKKSTTREKTAFKMLAGHCPSGRQRITSVTLSSPLSFLWLLAIPSTYCLLPPVLSSQLQPLRSPIFSPLLGLMATVAIITSKHTTVTEFPFPIVVALFVSEKKRERVTTEEDEDKGQKTYNCVSNACQYHACFVSVLEVIEVLGWMCHCWNVLSLTANVRARVRMRVVCFACVHEVVAHSGYWKKHMRVHVLVFTSSSQTN